MLERALPELVVTGIPYGTHETPWDLRVLLHRGGAGARRDHAEKRIREGTLGAVIEDRIPLIERIHAALSTWVAAGAAKSTVVNACSTFYMFCAWVDEAGGMLAIDTCAALFRDWTEVLLRRVRAKELLYKAAYHHAARCATLLVRAVGALGESAGTNMAAQLLSQTRMQPLRNSKNPIGTNSDKQNLQKTLLNM